MIYLKNASRHFQRDKSELKCAGCVPIVVTIFSAYVDDKGRFVTIIRKGVKNPLGYKVDYEKYCFHMSLWWLIVLVFIGIDGYWSNVLQ